MPLDSMAIVFGPCWTNFCSHKSDWLTIACRIFPIFTKLAGETGENLTFNFKDHPIIHILLVITTLQLLRRSVSYHFCYEWLLYMSGCIYSLKSITNDKFLRNFFHVNFIYSYVLRTVYKDHIISPRADVVWPELRFDNVNPIFCGMPSKISVMSTRQRQFTL